MDIMFMLMSLVGTNVISVIVVLKEDLEWKKNTFTLVLQNILYNIHNMVQKHHHILINEIAAQKRKTINLDKDRNTSMM